MTTSKERAPGPGWTELPQILRDPLAATQRLAREYGPVVRVPIGPFAYVPFGGGQRKCIGASFASMKATLVLARLAQRFHVEVTPGATVRPRPSFALRPRDGVPVCLRAL